MFPNTTFDYNSLYGKLRPYLNKVYIAQFDGVCSTDILVFPQSSHISNKFIAYRFLSPDFVSFASQRVSGVQHPRVSWKDIGQFSLYLPPLSEQQRIVTKIEEFFTRLDAGVEALKKIKVQLKRYRQAVLKYAFEGKLTEKWREAHKDELEPASVLPERIKAERKKQLGNKYKEPPPVDASKLYELPKGWAQATLAEIAEIVLGQSPPSSTYNKDHHGLPFYQGKAEFGSFYPTPQQWCSSPKKIVQKNDVLISVRAPVGPTNICPDISCIGRGLAAIRPLGEINSFFLLYLLRAAEHEIAGKGTGTTFDAITGEQLRSFDFPLPPLPEQERITEEIERHFSVADEVEQIIDQSLKRAQGLRQSILKQAFEGKLVPQDPNDEPAEKLLERIKAEKARIEEEKKAKKVTSRKGKKKGG